MPSPTAGSRWPGPSCGTSRWTRRRSSSGWSLLKAFTAAKRAAYGDLARTAALAVSLPFAREEYERAVAAMGADYWAYGIEPNRHVLATFARYAAGQHLIRQPPDPADLFAPETGEEFII